MAMDQDRQGRNSGDAGVGRRNRRTAWIVLSIAIAFFAGVILKRILLG